jgi:Thioredoxin
MKIIETALQGMTYRDYADLIELLHGEQKVTGPTQSDELLEYSLHNKKRMDRLDKTFQVLPEVTARIAEIVTKDMIWLTITEGWCGDASQIVPIIDAMANVSPHVTHRLILRDDNLETMDQFLTNGGRAIPIIVFIDKQSGAILGHWGPRPVGAQGAMADYKMAISKPDITDEEKAAAFAAAKLNLHSWYGKNKGLDTQNEIMESLAICMEAMTPIFDDEK